MIRLPALLPKRRRIPTFPEAVTNRMLTGLFVEGSCLHLRFNDAVIAVDLETRSYRYEKHRDPWLAFHGWLGVVRVLQDAHQVILVASGAVYSAQISIRNTQGCWQIFFPSRI